jgi:RNA polymerase sigma factor (sigma-70 family)
MTPDDELGREFYGYAREVWKVWAGRAGWRGRLSCADSIQAAAMHCWAVRDKYRPDLSSRRSFFTLCARRCITELARQQRVRRNVARPLSLDVRFPDGGPMIEPVDPQPRPCELAERSDELERLMDAVQELPPREWYAVWAHQIQGLTLELVGSDLGMTREGARQVEARGLRQLTANLTRARIQQ